MAEGGTEPFIMVMKGRFANSRRARLIAAARHGR